MPRETKFVSKKQAKKKAHLNDEEQVTQKKVTKRICKAAIKPRAPLEVLKNMDFYDLTGPEEVKPKPKVPHKNLPLKTDERLYTQKDLYLKTVLFVQVLAEMDVRTPFQLSKIDYDAILDSDEFTIREKALKREWNLSEINSVKENGLMVIQID